MTHLIGMLIGFTQKAESSYDAIS